MHSSLFKECRLSLVGIGAGKEFVVVSTIYGIFEMVKADGQCEDAY